MIIPLPHPFVGTLGPISNPLTIYHHIVFLTFLFLIGACIGSFLNVVVWRLPREESLSHPPSHCPECNTRLAWRDNIPVFGWLFLRGRCRYCAVDISARYPIVEFITGSLLVGYYVLFFLYRLGPCNPPFTDLRNDWPAFALLMFLICALIAASLIDAEQFIIPLQIPWLLAIVRFVVHPIIDGPKTHASLNLDPHSLAAAIAAGGSIGLTVS